MTPSGHQYSSISLWVGLSAALLLLTVLLETFCLGILYLDDSLKGRDTSGFTKTHLLTRLFVSTPPDPVAGKKFLGNLKPNSREWAKWLVPDSLLGWHLAASVSVFDGGSLFITDDHGFIADVDDPPVVLQKSADAYRVIVLGGSTVMGGGAPRPSLNIVGMLRKGIRERGLTGPNGKRVELINAGVDAYNSAQEYLYLISDLIRFKPDLIIVYDGWNDSMYDLNKNLSPFRTNAHAEIQRHLTESYSIPGSVFLVAENLEIFLTSSDHKLGIAELPWRVFNKLTSKAENISSSSAPFNPRNVEFYNINRQAFLALADNQTSVALFLQPVVGTDDRALSAEEKASWWYPRLSEALGNRVPFYDHARQILADLTARYQGSGHHCIADLSHSLKGVTKPVYADTGHMLPEGNEVVAAHILDQLVLCDLLR